MKQQVQELVIRKDRAGTTEPQASPAEGVQRCDAELPPEDESRVQWGMKLHV